MSSAARERVYAVKVGTHPEDECPLCGIHRRHAGYLRETCGEGFGKPECFVVAPEQGDPKVTVEP